MTLLKALRPRFPFGNTMVERGEVIDSADYPDIPESKWLQLREQRWFAEVDAPGSSVKSAASSRQSAEVDRARALLAPAASETESFACGECEFVAKNPHGLKVHVGRRHRAA